jgi:hypothetical protein
MFGAYSFGMLANVVLEGAQLKTQTPSAQANTRQSPLRNEMVYSARYETEHRRNLMHIQQMFRVAQLSTSNRVIDVSRCIA